MDDMQLTLYIEKYKQKIPESLETKLDHVTYLMLFMDCHKKHLPEFQEDMVFDTLYDMPVGVLKMFCSGIKYFANEGAVESCVQFYKDQINSYMKKKC